MTDDEPVTDPSAQGTCTFTADELDIPQDLPEHLVDWRCSRPVWEQADAPRCVWHAEGTDKPPEDLTATVEDGDLSGARARESDLTTVSFPERSNLIDADLSGADLRNADLSKVDLALADLSAVRLNQSTRVKGFCGRPNLYNGWDQLARGSHDLKAECSSNGLDEKARTVRSLERRARTREALARRDIPTVLGGLLSRFLTGYGTRVSYVLFWTVAVLVLTTLWYGWIVPTNSWQGGPLYYSVVTFVTSPPHPPQTGPGMVGTATEAIILFETYFGTTLIILLGYVLSNRDQF